MKLIILFYLFLQIVISTQKSPGAPRSIDPDYRPIPKSVFTVVAPTVIRQGKSFDVYVRGFGITESVYLTIRINGTSDEGDKLKLKKYAKISRSSSKKSVSFDTSDIASGTYSLVVETDDGYFEQRSLTYMTKKFSFFIQFNKAIFAPSDLLQFRIFAIDSETKAVTPTCASTITITDPNRNVIQSSQDVIFKRGKYEASFQLTDKASLGSWMVEVQCDQMRERKYFEIAEYTLPLLDVKLTVPAVTPLNNGIIPITVDATYTSGGVVSGSALIKIAYDGFDLIETTLNVNFGTATYDLHIVDIQVPDLSKNLLAKLIFEDSLTGIKVTDQKSFSITPTVYRFVTKSLTRLRPGFEWKFVITMIHVDGSPALEGTKINIDPDRKSTLSPRTLTIGEHGSVTSSYFIPKNVTSVSMEIVADNAVSKVLRERFTLSGTGEYCKIEVLTMSPRINEPVLLEIRTGYPLEFVMVHVVSKGLLLESTKVYFDSDDNEDNDLSSVVYKIKTSFKNAPLTEVIAYYINGQGNFITGKVYIRFANNDLPNYLEITPATQDVKPGEEISLNIESKVGSRVSLVAIDQRVLMLKSGFNFTKDSVFKDLSEYTRNRVNHDNNNFAEYEYNFGDCGLFVFTNILRPRRKYQRSIRREGDDVMRRSRGSLKVRNDFRETFLWREVAIYDSADDENDDTKGLETITEKVPESITTYLIFGVSMSKYDGMGLSDNVPSVSIFLPFFLSVDLPYSIKRNEVLVQDIYIFNYLKKKQTVEVKIKKDAKFAAVNLENNGWKDIKGFYVKSITTVVGQNIKLHFALKSSSLGYVPFEITAKGALAGDGIKKQLRIIPEGIPRSLTSSVFIALDSKNPEFKTTLNCIYPKSAIKDTTSVTATVAGDIFGKALSNLDKLISMPGGCGEQTMLGLAPDIAIYQYLKASDKLTSTLKTTLKNYINSGYQNELRYQRYDGSFSAFGKSDKNGSTWLTAYVVEYFYFAKSIVNIDLNIIKEAADFIVRQQQEDGSFKEPGNVIHADMQGGSGEGIGLTAYCVIMFTILLPDYPDYKDARNKAMKYLEDNYSSGRTTYELGIIAYALKVADSDKANSAYNKFFALKKDEPPLLYWAASTPQNNEDSFNPPRSLDIEITSYGLLTVIARSGNLATVLKIVKYLVSQANNLGGYSSSQDTVMALYALSQFAKTYSSDSDVELTMTPNVGDAITASVDSSNAFTLQSFDLNASTKKMKVVATTEESGLAIVSLICNFYEDPKKVVPVFEVTYNFVEKCNRRIIMNACAKYIPNGKSNMAIMIVTLPSGFIYNARESQNNNPGISKIEITNQETKATFYFNSISNEQSCATVYAYRSKVVNNLKESTIEVYDYYDTSKQGMTSYPASDLSEKCTSMNLR